MCCWRCSCCRTAPSRRKPSSSTPTPTRTTSSRRATGSPNTCRAAAWPSCAAATYPGTPGDRVDAIAHISCEALAAWVAAHHGEPLYVGGASHLAAEQEAFASTTTSGLLELLEQHVVLCALLRELLGPGLTVRIGAENELADLRECSLVLAPYIVEGETVGTVGVLGPTRMDYRKAQAAVTTVSRQLGQQLSR